MLGQASPGPDIGADASDTRPEHRHHSRPAMYLRYTRAAQSLAPVPQTFVPRAPTPWACDAHVLRQPFASGDGGDASVGV